MHPVWDRHGGLLSISARTDWWNLYRATWSPTPTVAALFTRATEICEPHWVFQRAPYAFIDAAHSKIARTATRAPWSRARAVHAMP